MNEPTNQQKRTIYFTFLLSVIRWNIEQFVGKNLPVSPSTICNSLLMFVASAFAANSPHHHITPYHDDELTYRISFLNILSKCEFRWKISIGRTCSVSRCIRNVKRNLAAEKREGAFVCVADHASGTNKYICFNNNEKWRQRNETKWGNLDIRGRLHITNSTWQWIKHFIFGLYHHRHSFGLVFVVWNFYFIVSPSWCV